MSLRRAAIVAALAGSLGFALGMVGTKARTAPAAEPASAAMALASLEARLTELQRSNELQRTNAALRAQPSITGAECQRDTPPDQPRPATAAFEPEAVEAPEVDVAAEKAAEQGQALLASLSVRGEWTEAERRSWKAAVGRAGRQHGTELLVALSKAINAGQVRPQL